MAFHRTPFDDPAPDAPTQVHGMRSDGRVSGWSSNPAPDAPYSLAVMALACIVFGLVCAAVFLVVVA